MSIDVTLAGSRGLLALLFMCAAAYSQDGAAAYKEHCAQCHDKGVQRAPQLGALKALSPESILEALTSGKMAEQGKSLTTSERRAVAMFVSGKAFGTTEAANQGACSGTTPPLEDPLTGPHWNGWGVGPSNDRFQPAAMAGLTAAQAPRLKLKWAFGYAGVLRASGQPTVAAGRVFVGSEQGRVYALDATSGCTSWSFKADANVRTAMSIGRLGQKWALYFGDQRAQAYAVDAATGSLIWKVRVEAHPAAVITGAPALYRGRLYVPFSSYEEVTGANPKYECCKFRGGVTALDAESGKQIWRSYTIPEEPRPVRKNKQGTQLWGPSGAGVWSSPTIDPKKHVIYVTTGDSYSDPAANTSDAFVAFDMETGKMLWSRQLTSGDAFNVGCPNGDNCPESKGPDYDFGCSPALVDLPNGKRALIAGQKSGMVHALDPDQQGEVLWQKRVGQGGSLGGVQWGVAADRRNVYVALSDFKIAYMGTARPGANRTVFGTFASPDSKAGGGTFALDLATGERAWYTAPPGCGDKPGCSPAQSAAVTAVDGVVFSGSLDGHLRAYSSADGKILWDVDTARDYETVNGVPGKGGSIDGPGPVIAGGTLYVNSGYGFFGGMPGNVLLAFTVDGK
ncbi:MAG: PQQ-binding-like beta-propeller repeat protein [Bryobacteraceae bacterium]